tara:strand:+ start:965 stop:1324 length:360 start_codon:yes stop_codon:yes gene_type:complete
MSITTHVLDTALGLPGRGIHTILERMTSIDAAHHQEVWESIAEGVTNNDGRIPGFIPENCKIVSGTYRITFFTADYFKSMKKDCFYPYASIVFEINEPESHYHVPLLISGFGFSTYRGS